MAKKFNFKLDPVLKLRTYRVKEAKEDLGKTVSKRVSTETEIQNKRDYLDTFIKSKKGRQAASELQNQWNHKEFVENQIEKLNREREELLKLEDKKRIVLENAMKKEKAIEKLKEKRKSDYHESIYKEETKELDEIGRNMKRFNKEIKKDEP